MRLLGVWPFVSRGGGANIGFGIAVIGLLILCTTLCGIIGALLATGKLKVFWDDEGKEKTEK